jgi:hypothetical protein
MNHQRFREVDYQCFCLYLKENQEEHTIFAELECKEFHLNILNLMKIVNKIFENFIIIKI